MREQGHRAKTIANPIPTSTHAANMTTLFSIIESPSHPRLDALYQRLCITQIKLPSQRKALRQALTRASLQAKGIIGDSYH